MKHDSFFHTCLTFCKYVWEKPNLCVKYHTCSFWQMFDFYPTCLEKTKHVGIFTPGCYFPHMFGFWHIGMGKGTHVWKKPHNYMFANVWHFPHMCGKSHWHAYFPLSYGWGAVLTKVAELAILTNIGNTHNAGCSVLEIKTEFRHPVLNWWSICSLCIQCRLSPKWWCKSCQFFFLYFKRRLC